VPLFDDVWLLASEGLVTCGRILTQDGIKNGLMGLDIGPATIQSFCVPIMSAKTILWNGPMGVYEMESFSKGTKVCV